MIDALHPVRLPTIGEKAPRDLVRFRGARIGYGGTKFGRGARARAAGRSTLVHQASRPADDSSANTRDSSPQASRAKPPASSGFVLPLGALDNQ